MDLGAIEVSRGHGVLGREMMALGAVQMGVGSFEAVKIGEEIREEVIIN